jgi:hypothetical protein
MRVAVTDCPDTRWAAVSLSPQTFAPFHQLQTLLIDLSRHEISPFVVNKVWQNSPKSFNSHVVFDQEGYTFSLDGRMSEEGVVFRRAQLHPVMSIVKIDEPFDPVAIGLFCASAVVA